MHVIRESYRTNVNIVLSQLLGKDISAIFNKRHWHSDLAFQCISQFEIGRLVVCTNFLRKIEYSVLLCEQDTCTTSFSLPTFLETRTDVQTKSFTRRVAASLQSSGCEHAESITENKICWRLRRYSSEQLLLSFIEAKLTCFNNQMRHRSIFRRQNHLSPVGLANILLKLRVTKRVLLHSPVQDCRSLHCNMSCKWIS